MYSGTRPLAARIITSFVLESIDVKLDEKTHHDSRCNKNAFLVLNIIVTEKRSFGHVGLTLVLSPPSNLAHDLRAQ